MFSFIEVCAGCGGLCSGLMKAGGCPLLLNEMDRTCCMTLRKNHTNVEVVEETMTTLSLKNYVMNVDLLCGGVPCQAFSHAGRREGIEDERGHLIVDFNRLIQECRPKMFLVENVKGLITHRQGATFNSILRLYENNGDYIVHHKIMNTNDYDVPQRRERVVIIGIRKDIYTKPWNYPAILEYKPVLNDVLQNVPMSDGVVYNELKKSIMARIPQGGNWKNLPHEIQRLYMGNAKSSGIAKRLSMSEPSMTLTTSPDQKITERCHPLETRPLTIREYARIQTFPDEYIFEGSIRKQYKQIGNAVPVMFAYHLGLAINTYLSR